MKVKVEECWNGGENYSFRCTFPDGTRFIIEGDVWTRSMATQLRDFAVRHYRVKRDSVKVI